MQCGARGEHRDSLLPNTQMLEKKIYGQPEVKKINHVILSLRCLKKKRPLYTRIIFSSMSS